ncbi:MAG TPA: hypothetical protein VM121_08685 [Acidimicrobiales bacterium]|nr:hypothetical protein [Acidimicrobiales bacterium]
MAAAALLATFRTASWITATFVQPALVDIDAFDWLVGGVVLEAPVDRVVLEAAVDGVVIEGLEDSELVEHAAADMHAAARTTPETRGLQRSRFKAPSSGRDPGRTSFPPPGSRDDGRRSPSGSPPAKGPLYVVRERAPRDPFPY